MTYLPKKYRKGTHAKDLRRHKPEKIPKNTTVIRVSLEHEYVDWLMEKYGCTITQAIRKFLLLNIDLKEKP